MSDARRRKQHHCYADQPTNAGVDFDRKHSAVFPLYLALSGELEICRATRFAVVPRPLSPTLKQTPAAPPYNLPASHSNTMRLPSKQRMLAERALQLVNTIECASTRVTRCSPNGAAQKTPQYL